MIHDGDNFTRATSWAATIRRAEELAAEFNDAATRAIQMGKPCLYKTPYTIEMQAAVTNAIVANETRIVQ